MALTLTIAGVDRTNLIIWDSINLQENLTNQVDTLAFRIQKFGSRTFQPTVLEEVIFSENGVPVFGGNIISFNETVASVDRQIFNITVKDFTHVMNRRVVIERFTDRPVINIIIEMLNRYINRESRITIASFEESETWIGGTIDTDNFRLGDQALRLTSTNSVQDNMERNIYLNLQPTGFAASDLIEIDASVDNVTNLQTATLILGDDTLTNFFSKDITSDLANDGWNLSRNVISTLSTTGAPDLTNIRRIRIELTSTGGTTVNMTVDNWQVLKAGAFTRNSSFNATQNVNFIAFNYEFPSQCLQRLAELFQWNWYVDEVKDIHFFPKFEVSAPFGLTDLGGNHVDNSLKINSNADQMRNAIYVRGGDYVGETLTEDLAHQADGLNRIFKLGYGYKDISLEVNGTLTPVGVDNLDGFSDNLGARQIVEGNQFLNIGDVAANSFQSQQVIVTKSGRRSGERLRLRKVGNPVDNLEVEIYSDSGSNEPSGTALSNVTTLAGGLISGASQEFTFALTEASTNDLFFDVNVNYHIRLGRSGAPDAANYYQLEYATNVEYEGYANTGNSTPTWNQVQLTWYFIEQINYDVLYSFQEKIITFNAPPLITDTIDWTGDPFFPILIQSNENSSISEFGRYEFKIIDKSIKTRNGAKQRALQEILAWADEITQADFLTFTTGLRAGQTINIQSDIRGLDEDYMIQQITAKTKRVGGDDTLQYKVRCVTTRTLGMLYWLQKQIMKDDREIEIDENELEDKIESIFESFGFEADYTLTLLEGKVWSNDAETTPNRLVWDGGATHIWV